MSAERSARHDPQSGGGDDVGAIRRLLYPVSWLLGNLLFGIWFRLRVRHRPTPFPSGPLVVAANHVSFLDPVTLALTVPRRITYLVTSTVFDVPWFRPWMWFFGCIRVQDGAVNVDAMRRALAVLRRGGVVGIFPEGGISDDGQLHEGQIGVASLLLQGRAPVLTVAIVGTFEALPRHRRFPRPHAVEVRYSEIVQPSAIGAGLPPREARRLLRDRVMAGIAAALPPAMGGR